METHAPVYNQCYVDAGDGQAVLLLHGLFGNLRMWASTVKSLKSNYRVIIPRLPLFDLPAGNTNLPYLVDVLQDFILWHNLTNVVIVGHGMGSQLALLYASRYPANVRRLVISGSTGFMSDPNSPYLDTNELDFDLVEERVQTAFYQPDMVPKKLVDHVFSTVQDVQNRVTIDALFGSSRETRFAFLNRIDHPILLLWGLEDKITPPEVAMNFRDFLQNSVIHFIERCGHVPMIEQPEVYNWHVTHFLDA